MIAFEEHIRLLVILHAVIGAALVAAATHLALWSRKLARGQHGRLKATRWFAGLSLALYLLSFALGNLVYPTYKIRVRVEYFDDPIAQVDEAAMRQGAHVRAEKRRVATAEPGDSPAAARAGNLPRVARIFDIKEHWSALGLPLAFAAFVLALTLPKTRAPGARAAKDDDGDEPADATAAHRLLVWCAYGVAFCAWLAAIIGLYVSSFRSVGAIS